MTFEDVTLYPNPYMVVTKKGYTKHYYVGSERLATVIGTGGWERFLDRLNLDDPAMNPSHPNTTKNKTDYAIVNAFREGYKGHDPLHQLLSRQVENSDISGDKRWELGYNCKPVILETLEIQYRSDILAATLVRNAQNNGPENDVYYYHGDHLGSASWVTNKSGEVIAEYKYAPYGELVFSEKEGDYDERYKFTGKERDAESGYDYFGARYFWSAFGHFMSPDELSVKHPEISSYAYCDWNPIKYVDPDGRFPLASPLIRYIALAKTMESSQGHNVRTTGFAMQHPISALRTGDAQFPTGGISNIACNFQVNLQNQADFSKGPGGQGNAYRHTLWQTLLTNSFGSDLATRIGYAHEDNLPENMSSRIFSVFDDADKMADLLNNAIGQGIGTNNKGLSNKQYAELVLDEYKNNGLWIVTGNAKDGYSVQKSKLTQEQYDKALQVVKTKGNNGLTE